MLRERGLGINVAALVPLSPLRRYALGEEATEYDEDALRYGTPSKRASA